MVSEAPTPWGVHRPRAAVLVGGPAAPYSRGLRVARALVDQGFEVEIAAVAAKGLPVREMDGPIEIRRYAPSGPFAAMAVAHGDPQAPGAARTPGRPGVRVIRRLLGAARRWAFWPHTVRGWWATLERELVPAELYHACGSLTIAAALSARGRAQASPGRPTRVVYDAIDDVIGSNNMLRAPRVVVRLLARRERSWARAADARTTVNDELATRLAARWGTSVPLSVPNYPEVPSSPVAGPAPDRIRTHLGLPPSTRVVLFQGRLGPNLGLDEAAEAVLLVPDAVLVLIGFGRRAAELRARDDDPRFAGRHFTLPPVHPDELPEWTASADVSLVPLPPVSDNQRLSTPNKFWESLIVGTPVVVPAALEVMARIVRELDAGALAASTEPADLAAAIRAVLDRTGGEQARTRRRVAGVARERYSWPAVADRYRALIESIMPSVGDPRAR